VHLYQEFVDYRCFGTTAYIYKPDIPVVKYEEITDEQVINRIKAEDVTVIVNQLTTQETIDYYKNFGAKVIVIYSCDWREIIYQMAKDYRKHNHEDDFYVQIRKNNGRDLNGEWRYPNGITSYEPFYIDLEGFWRQLYCPPGLGGGDMKDAIIQDGKLY